MFTTILVNTLLVLLLLGALVFLVHMMNNTSCRMETKVFNLISFLVCVIVFCMIISLRYGGVL